MAVDDVLFVSKFTHITTDPLRSAVTGLSVKVDFSGSTPGADTLEKDAVVELMINGSISAVEPPDETRLVSEALLNSSHRKNIPDVVQVSSS